MTKKRKTSSARDLILPDHFDSGKVPFKDMSPQERLVTLAARSGPNKNEVAANLVIACIEDGVRDGPSIVDLLQRAGLDETHARSILAKELKARLRPPRWTRDASGMYDVTEI